MKFTTIAVLSLPAGYVIGLTDAQAQARAAMLVLHPSRKGWYVTRSPVQFKVGEVLLCDDDLPKNLAQLVVDADGRKPKAASKAKPKAAAPQAPAEQSAQTVGPLQAPAVASAATSATSQA